MSYKYDPINKILVKTKDSDPIAALQNFKKHAEYGDSFKLDIKGKKAMVQKEADGWYISYEGRKEKGPYKIIEAAVKEFMKDSKTVDESWVTPQHAFNALDRTWLNKYQSFTTKIEQVTTSKDCEALVKNIKREKDYYMNEYLDSMNDLSKYAQTQRNNINGVYSKLESDLFKKYQELKKAGK